MKKERGLAQYCRICPVSELDYMTHKSKVKKNGTKETKNVRSILVEFAVNSVQCLVNLHITHT